MENKEDLQSPSKLESNLEKPKTEEENLNESFDKNDSSTGSKKSEEEQIVPDIEVKDTPTQKQLSESKPSNNQTSNNATEELKEPADHHLERKQEIIQKKEEITKSKVEDQTKKNKKKFVKVGVAEWQKFQESFEDNFKQMQSLKKKLKQKSDNLLNNREELREAHLTIEEKETQLQSIRSESIKNKKRMEEEVKEFKEELQGKRDEKKKLLERNKKLLEMWEEMNQEIEKNKKIAVQLDCKNYELMEEKKDMHAELEFCRGEAKQKTLIEGQVRELQAERLRLSMENQKFKNSKTINKLKEAEKIIGRLRKQVEVLRKHNDKLRGQNKGHVSLSLKSQGELKKNEHSVNQLKEEKKELVQKLEMLEKFKQDKQDTKETDLKEFMLKEVKLQTQNNALKDNLREVKNLIDGIKQQNENQQLTEKKKREELEKEILMLEKKSERKGFGLFQRSREVNKIKEEKGIMREMAEQKNKLEAIVNQKEREKNRFKLKYEDSQARLKQKEAHLKFLCEEFISSISTGKVRTLSCYF